MFQLDFSWRKIVATAAVLQNILTGLLVLSNNWHFCFERNCCCYRQIIGRFCLEENCCCYQTICAAGTHKWLADFALRKFVVAIDEQLVDFAWGGILPLCFVVLRFVFSWRKIAAAAAVKHSNWILIEGKLLLVMRLRLVVLLLPSDFRIGFWLKGKCSCCGCSLLFIAAVPNGVLIEFHFMKWEPCCLTQVLQTIQWEGMQRRFFCVSRWMLFLKSDSTKIIQFFGGVQILVVVVLVILWKVGIVSVRRGFLYVDCIFRGRVYVIIVCLFTGICTVCNYVLAY